MAVNAYIYGKLTEHMFNKLVDLDTDTIKVALCTDSYVPNQDTHDFFDDITNELSAGTTGYTVGGETLTGTTASYTSDTNTFKFDAADVVWGTATITARYAIIYSVGTTASNSPLIAYVDFGANMSSTAGDFTITWDAAGIFTVTVA